ncbi:MAG: 1-acyl-sn-glycerol-3-phosphate acyltransferase [Bacteroidota bacterium]|nr:1-acyl-sn-glycerol-3-phosphate acyltransferase [Bacteroidota bacterium]
MKLEVKPEGDIENKINYKPILPGPENWPVVQLSRNRKSFIQEVIAESIRRVKSSSNHKNSLIEELETTLYRESLRIRNNPWRVDPADEASFWREIKTKLVHISNDPENSKYAEEDILEEIVSRYAHEIAGNFNPSSYRMARSLVTFGFSRLLNAARVKGFRSLWSTQLKLGDKIQITGETDQIRNLAKIGTVIMVPTHFSNLDSVLIGWVIHSLGLPPFIYGAGLNLFNIEVLAYFMNSLGAYKVDRRKKNSPYLETLKTYSSLAIQKGCHSLFFPGGTRSRSGKIESNLKLGLLGTAMEAQRINYQKNPDGEARKIFIVPVTLNYHFVLEAPVLINEYLKMKGQERYYVETDEYSTSFKITTFLIKFFTKGSDISVSIGKGMDILGNYVDDAGNSLDAQGRIINTCDYFITNGIITKDKQREEEYTRMLGKAIVQEFKKINRIFSSHLVAYTAFYLLRKQNPKLDLFSILRLPEEEQVIKYEDFKSCFSKLRDIVFKMHQQGLVGLAPHMKKEVDEVIRHGITNVGMYHIKRPLIFTESGDITTQDLNTLFYYHNRMKGYGLQKHIR